MVHMRQYHDWLLSPEKEIFMSGLSYRMTVPAPRTRSIVIAALMGATVLVGPLTVARADTVANAAGQSAQPTAPQSSAAAGATETKGETVEQRITTLHVALKITSDENAKWNAVAQAMRENAAAMDKLIAETRITPPQNMTAVDDLRMYQKFSEAHVTGLKNLIASFDALYAAMPDAQKKNADVVFQTSGRKAAAAHS
jgi:periplasmic protein CpxP/Spy